jgi:hypothetical protein
MGLAGLATGRNPGEESEVNAFPGVQGSENEQTAAFSLLSGDSSAFIISLLVHLGALLTLGAIPVVIKQQPVEIVLTAAAPIEREQLEQPEEFRFSLQPSETIGASSPQGEALLSLAPVVSEVAAIPSPFQMPEVPIENPTIEINNLVAKSSGLNYAENLAIRGVAGEGTTGAVGAIDRITHEILLSLEERKTLVVWLFDQTASLIPQRKAIRDRFERIHKELGVIEATGNAAFLKHDDKPFLSSVVSFGQGLNWITKQPTDDLAALRQAVMELPEDKSGTENVFGAIYETSKKYAEFRRISSERAGPERNVLLVVFTDEAGSDANKAEEAIKMCRRWAMPVYVIGVPAPFGRKETEMKWVDPDPKYDQTPRWGLVEQGPETFYPERIKLGFAGSVDDEAPLDSGFGPFALTRLCVETGGIYFAVHPNRDVRRPIGRGETAAYSAHLQRFYDPEVMRRYRPEYVSIGEYQKRVGQNKARTALVQAATSSEQLRPVSKEEKRFVKTDDARFARELSTAQQEAALVEPKINALYNILLQGEAAREKETVLRWQAGYDLAMGRTLAAKVRTETFNAMLAAAKRGLKPTDAKNNTWTLRPADDISVGSQYAKIAERAKMYLDRVVKEHPGTPWAHLAQRELNDPLGWKWVDSYTDLAPPPRQVAVNVNNNPPPPSMPRSEKKKMLERKELRPLPKL